jgi:hypothetical protein
MQHRVFFKKGLKKLKFEKRVSAGNNLKNGRLPPVDRAGGVCSKFFLQAPPEGPFANKKVSYSQRGS